MAEVINYREAIERAGGNVELAKELFSMLLKELPALREELRRAITARDFRACWEHAHKIYGSTTYCAVPTLYISAQATEAAVKAGDLAELEKHFATLCAAIEDLLVSGTTHLQADWQA